MVRCGADWCRCGSGDGVDVDEISVVLVAICG